jgi:3-deoxy-D-manno-octulosonic acid kinase
MAGMQTGGAVTDERIVADARGAVVFAPDLVVQVDADWFDAAWWRTQGKLRDGHGGRGGVAYVDAPQGECVLRHYHRGGMVAALLGDRYRWHGADRTRSFAEFRLLQRLRALVLPVPAAVAARYRRHGPYYTADIITLRIADADTLAHRLAQGRFDEELAAQVGTCIARFHRHGVFHADLNAHNVLVNPQGIHLIDFDRGHLRAPAGTWPRANLHRLRRSLLKLGAAGGDPRLLDATLWRALIQAWSEAMRA